jgi:predicted transcriptional regulator YheO
MSEFDDTLVESASRIADAIGQTLGPSCEIAVHDLRDPTHSLVHLVNGHVTGRQIGAPIRDLIYRVLPSLDSRQGGLFNYLTVLDDGRRLKSSTCLLRNAEGAPLVAFCVNLDVTHLEAAANILGELSSVREGADQLAAANRPEPPQSDNDEVTAILHQLVVNIVRPAGREPGNLSKRDRVAIVQFLDRKGAFRIKGAVPMVARELGASEQTIYRHIDEVRRGDEAPRRKRAKKAGRGRLKQPA